MHEMVCAVSSDMGGHGAGEPCLRCLGDDSVRRTICISLATWLCLALISLSGEIAPAADSKVLRVCADPDNLPFSNQQSQGFENKIAELIAQDLGAELSYTWWPHQRGMVRRTLNEGRCDVLIGIPKGYDPVLWTTPYYRTAYVIAYVRDRGPHVASLDDPILRQVKIGVHVNTPPHDALTQRGIGGDHVTGYRLFYTPQDNQEESPVQPLEDLLAEKIDVALIWGAFAGYFSKKRSAPLELVPLEGGGPTTPLSFEISMGVRKGDKALKAELEGALSRQAGVIRTVLQEYGVPLLALQRSDGKSEPQAPREGHSGEGGARHH
jgi:mxaJ protein